MGHRTAVTNDVVTYRGPNGRTSVARVLGHQRSAPVAGDFTVTPSATGGSLADATYSYKVTAVVDGVETPASVAETGVVAASSGNGSVTINFTVGIASFPTLSAWKVYGRTADAWELIASRTPAQTTYVDTGAVTPDGEPPEETGAVTLRDSTSQTVRSQVPSATEDRQSGVYYNR